MRVQGVRRLHREVNGWKQQNTLKGQALTRIKLEL